MSKLDDSDLGSGVSHTALCRRDALAFGASCAGRRRAASRPSRVFPMVPPRAVRTAFSRRNLSPNGQACGMLPGLGTNARR